MKRYLDFISEEINFGYTSKDKDGNELKVGDKVIYYFKGTRFKAANNKTATITSIWMDGTCEVVFNYPRYKRVFTTQADMSCTKIIEHPETDQYEEWDETNEQNRETVQIGNRIEVINDPSRGNEFFKPMNLLHKKGTVVHIIDDYGSLFYMVEMDEPINGLEYFLSKEIFCDDSDYLESIITYFKNHKDDNVIFLWDSVIKVIYDKPEDQYEEWDDVNEEVEYNLKDFGPIESLDELKIGDIVYMSNERGAPNRFGIVSKEKFKLNMWGDVIGVDMFDKDNLKIEHENDLWSNPEYILKLYKDETNQYEDWDEMNEKLGDNFNIGDRVIGIDTKDGVDLRDHIGTIVEFNPDAEIWHDLDHQEYQYCVEFDEKFHRELHDGHSGKHGTGKCWWVDDECIEHLEQKNVDQYEEWDDVNENDSGKYSEGDTLLCIKTFYMNDRKAYKKPPYIKNKTYTIKKIEGGEYKYVLESEIDDWHSMSKELLDEFFTIKLDTDQYEEWDDVNESIFLKKWKLGKTVKIIHPYIYEEKLQDMIGKISGIRKSPYNKKENQIEVEFPFNLRDIGVAPDVKVKGKKGYCRHFYDYQLELDVDTDQYEDWD